MITLVKLTSFSTLVPLCCQLGLWLSQCSTLDMSSHNGQGMLGLVEVTSVARMNVFGQFVEFDYPSEVCVSRR